MKVDIRLFLLHLFKTSGGLMLAQIPHDVSEWL